MRKFIHEICGDFENAKTRADKVAVLRRYGHPSSPDFQQEFQDVLQGAFHPAVQWVIKERPAFRPSYGPLGVATTRIAAETKKFYIWVEGSKKVNPNLTLHRKLVLAIQLLEALDRGEAELLVGMFLKRLDAVVPGLTYDVVEEALPGLLPASQKTVEVAAAISPAIVFPVPEVTEKPLSRRQKRKLKKLQEEQALAAKQAGLA